MKFMTVCVGLLLVALVLGTGCADMQSIQDKPSIGDPWKGFNKAMFSFNDTLYFWVVEPVASGWDWVLPDTVQRRLSYFFDNLDMPRRAVNATLQGDAFGGLVEVTRFGINTTIGFIGFWDPAGAWGLRPRKEDFGQTLAVWGTASGPYLVLPALGPSSVRDALGKIPDAVLSLSILIPGAGLVERINTVSLHLGEYEQFKQDSLAPYVAMRNAWYQHRVHNILNKAKQGAAPPAQ